jgi:hypothetical protein
MAAKRAEFDPEDRLLNDFFRVFFGPGQSSPERIAASRKKRA